MRLSFLPTTNQSLRVCAALVTTLVGVREVCAQAHSSVLTATQGDGVAASEQSVARVTILLRDGSELHGGLQSMAGDAITMLRSPTEDAGVTASPTEMVARAEVIAVWLSRDTLAQRSGSIRRPDGTIGPSIGGAQTLLSLEAARLRGEEEVQPANVRRPQNASSAQSSSPTVGIPGMAQGVLVLRNGERLAGSLNIAPDHVYWKHRSLGFTEVIIDEISELVLRPEMSVPEQTQVDHGDQFADVVELINGDVVRGFVESIGSDLVVSVDDGNQSSALGDVDSSVRVPLPRVARIRFADEGPPRDPPVQNDSDASRARLWLRDGSVVDAQELEIGADGQVRFTSSTLVYAQSQRGEVRDAQLFNKEEVGTAETSPKLNKSGACEIAVDDVTAIALHPSEFEVVQLRSLVRTPLSGGFHVAAPVNLSPTPDGQRTTIHDLGVCPFVLEGPVLAFISPPDQESAWLFVCDVVLDDTTIAGGGAEARIGLASAAGSSSASKSEASFRLSASDAPRRVCIPVRGSGVQIEVREGAHGLVGNAVRVERAIFVRVTPPGA